MKIKIESDVFDIVDRIKEIDDGYYIILNTQNNKFELHNRNQINSYCFSIENNCLDNRLIDKILYTSIINIDNIVNDIDNYNNEIENNNFNKISHQSKYMLNEFYKFANNSSRDIDDDKAFSTIWR